MPRHPPCALLYLTTKTLRGPELTEVRLGHSVYHHSYAQCKRTLSDELEGSVLQRQVTAPSLYLVPSGRRRRREVRHVSDQVPARCHAGGACSEEQAGWLLKEVIQPQVPLRLPCYDFTPITDQTVDGSFPKVGPPASGPANFRGVTGGVYKARERIHRSMLIYDY